jgi:methionyl-tRNA synthetase
VCATTAHSVATALNQDLELRAPWKLAKDPGAARELDALLVRHLSSAAEIVGALGPVAPGLAGRLSAMIGVPGQPLPEPVPGFQRVNVVGTDGRRSRRAWFSGTAAPSIGRCPLNRSVPPQ